MFCQVLFHSSLSNWILICIASFAMGLSKAGLKGIDLLNITIMALVFGSKASTGVVLPLLCVADVFAVVYYHRHADWKHFWKIIPWMIVGIVAAVFIGKELDEHYFRRVMAVIIILTVVIMLFFELRKEMKFPNNKLFVGATGLAAGFTTMFGNLASAFASIYFVAIRFPKNNFIGTAAWIFLFINFFKLPFQVVYWDNINLSTLKIDLLLLPVMIAGFWTGVKIVGYIKDHLYRKVIIGLTLIGAIFIFFK